MLLVRCGGTGGGWCDGQRLCITGSVVGAWVLLVIHYYIYIYEPLYDALGIIIIVLLLVSLLYGLGIPASGS